MSLFLLNKLCRGLEDDPFFNLEPVNLEHLACDHSETSPVIIVPSRLCKASRKRSRRQDGAVSNDGGFAVSFDVSDFKPDEISVKMVENKILINGIHEEQVSESGGLAKYRMSKTYVLPSGVDSSRVEARLADGLLKVTAPRKNIDPWTKGRTIPIQVETALPQQQQQQQQQQPQPELQAPGS